MAQPSGHSANLLPEDSPQSIFDKISARLFSASGIHLSKYCTPQSLTGSWVGVLYPTGLKFIAPANIGVLESELANSAKFARAVGGWDKLRIPKHGSMFREVSQNGSLHIILNRDKPAGECGIHFDKISIVINRKPDGSIEYTKDVTTLSRHAAMELCKIEQVDHVDTLMDGGGDRDGF